MNGLSLLSNFFDDFQMMTPATDGLRENFRPFAPRVDLHEEEGRYMLEADLPGIKKEDVKIEFNNGRLLISGKRQEEREKNKKNYYRSERYFGSFERSFQFYDDINESKIDASFDNGVLKIMLPKKEQEKAKLISIK